MGFEKAGTKYCVNMVLEWPVVTLRTRRTLQRRWHLGEGLHRR